MIVTAPETYTAAPETPRSERQAYTRSARIVCGSGALVGIAAVNDPDDEMHAVVPFREVPAFAAALLAAAGFKSYAVVDLGEPLPEVGRTGGAYIAEGFMVGDEHSDDLVRSRTRANLAVLAQRERAKPKHPAHEVDAVADIFLRLRDTDTGLTAIEEAAAVLDALAAARAAHEDERAEAEATPLPPLSQHKLGKRSFGRPGGLYLAEDGVPV